MRLSRWLQIRWPQELDERIMAVNGIGGTAVAPARESAAQSERDARIAALRASVQAGTYRVDPQTLAARLLDHPSNPLSVYRPKRGD